MKLMQDRFYFLALLCFNDYKYWLFETLNTLFHMGFVLVREFYVFVCFPEMIKQSNLNLILNYMFCLLSYNVTLCWPMWEFCHNLRPSVVFFQHRNIILGFQKWVCALCLSIPCHVLDQSHMSWFTTSR